MKKCNSCKLKLPETSFYVDNSAKDNLNGTCKKCLYKRRKGRSTIYSQKVVKTKKGLLKRIFYTQKRKSKLRGHPSPKYNINEFIQNSLLDRDFNLLFENWKKSNFIKSLKPSCDRLEDHKGYSFENTQWVTWEYNDWKNKNSERHKMAIRAISKSRTKVVLQFDTKMNLIKTWKNGTLDIKNYYKSINNIRAVCRGERNLAYGFIWKYG
ncbi:hypothetical protein [Flagellimonas nanhaiensis]|uniref:Uncharacterized protein n=1 Tax=Flagellimonas nanhaiensis TaxID=2292706 RepID=A0A371JLR2_9FLAO|nr:hypothetical protein [Allomuricauda nanhaiensis]RDY58016.1 hypothetical protein DX873_15910 [Allomuricauda nanhaiensis]